MRRASLVVFVVLVLMLVSGFAQTITVGYTMSNTGSFTVDSVEQARGFELWSDQVNAAGGIKAGGKSYKVQFVHYDDESKPQRVQQLYSTLIGRDKADFLFSPYSSGLTATAAVITEQNNKIMLTTGAAEEKPYKSRNKYLFQMFAPAGQYLKPALDALKAKDPKATIAFVYEDGSFSNAVLGPAKTYAEQQGFKVVFNEKYGPGTTDFSAILDKVVASKATVLMGGGHYADGSTLARQLSSRKAATKMVTLLVAPDSPKWVELGDAAIGVTVPSQWDGKLDIKTQYGPSIPDFVKAYRAKFHEDPSYESAGGYATGLVLQRAIEQAGSIDAQKVATALNATDVVTCYGRTKFATDPNEHGLQVGHAMVLSQWQKDKSGKLTKVMVWPKGHNTTDMMYPIH